MDRKRRLVIRRSLLLACVVLLAVPLSAFQPVLPQQHSRVARKVLDSRQASRSRSTTTTSLNFMGSDGGILGIGAPELATIMLVGYFVLGPSDLYKIVKEIGKFIQNVRTLGTDLTTTLESNMESQLQLEELRKAQRELNDAFSFRRSINFDQESEAFSTTTSEPTQVEPTEVEPTQVEPTAEAATAVAAAEGSTKPRKIRRRVRKKAVEESSSSDDGSVPSELEMPTAPTSWAATAEPSQEEKDISAQEAAEIEKEFEQYTSPKQDDEKWFSAETNEAEQSRFQQQFSGNWNEQILANQEQLEPLATVMNKIALLEKEKLAATQRLEEEFNKRQELETKYYREQRELLEQAAKQVQDAAVGLDSTTKASPKVPDAKAAPKV